jgi:hypothetical protein
MVSKKFVSLRELGIQNWRKNLSYIRIEKVELRKKDKEK